MGPSSKGSGKKKSQVCGGESTAVEMIKASEGLQIQ